MAHMEMYLRPISRVERLEKETGNTKIHGGSQVNQ